MPKADTAATEELELEDGFEENPSESTPAPVKKPAAEKAKPETDSEAKTLREELKRERESRAEAEENARFWHGKAKSSPAETPKAKETPKLTVDLVDAISSNDPVRIRQAMSELGFVDGSEVDRRVNATATTVRTEEQLYGSYPELRDPKSEFYKATAKHYNELRQDPALANAPSLMVVAARLAKAELATPAKDDEEEDDRAQRVARQSGDRGRRPASRGSGKDEPEELSGAQRSVIAKFQEAGAALTEEGYTKRAKAGVRMGGTPTRSRA
jgi:hypothetical protein